jgi:hypothetical protein
MPFHWRRSSLNTRQYILASIAMIFAALFISVIREALTGESFAGVAAEIVLLGLILLAVLRSYQTKFSESDHSQTNG